MTVDRAKCYMDITYRDIQGSGGVLGKSIKPCLGVVKLDVPPRGGDVEAKHQQEEQ